MWSDAIKRLNLYEQKTRVSDWVIFPLLYNTD